MGQTGVERLFSFLYSEGTSDEIKDHQRPIKDHSESIGLHSMGIYLKMKCLQAYMALQGLGNDFFLGGGQKC